MLIAVDGRRNLGKEVGKNTRITDRKFDEFNDNTEQVYISYGDHAEINPMFQAEPNPVHKPSQRTVIQTPSNKLRETPKPDTSSTTTASTVTPKPHNAIEHWTGSYEKKLMKEISEKPIALTGEPTLISNCPHDCNNKGLCQRIFVKAKTSDNPDTYSYEPKFSCACKENFKGEHCNECAKDFFGTD